MISGGERGPGRESGSAAFHLRPGWVLGLSLPGERCDGSVAPDQAATGFVCRFVADTVGCKRGWCLRAHPSCLQSAVKGGVLHMSPGCFVASFFFGPRCVGGFEVVPFPLGPDGSMGE